MDGPLAIDDYSRVGFNVPPNIMGHIGDDFYGSNDPTIPTQES